jgi:8-oxo-dGTP pyrophosphatase MutT (NUDIX family)
VYPGGHVKWYETPDEAAVREVFEETGIRARLLDTRGPSLALDEDELLNLPYVILSERIEFSPEPTHYHIDLVYLCRPVPEDEHKVPVHSPSEVREAKFFGAAEVEVLDMMGDVRQILRCVFDDASVWSLLPRG